MKIIPAIDIINGKCVRLTKGDYGTQKIYNNNPVEVAKQFEYAGIRHLHVVDLDGAKSGTIVNHKILNAIATGTNLKIDFGGGLKTNEDVQKAFDNGAAQITAGSIAVKEPETVYKWIATYGVKNIILGADCRNRRISINGWQEESTIDVVSFIKGYENKGIKTVICTDIEKDGMLGGPSNALYLEILTSTAINLIASGGVSSLKDLYRLKEIGCKGAIVGKAIYEGNITLKEISKLC